MQLSSLAIPHIQLEPAYTPFLKQPIRVISSTYPLQELQVLLAITLKRLLPLRAIVQVSISMARMVSRCESINLLDSVARRRLDELVVPALSPVYCEAYYNERIISTVVQAQRIRITLFYPVREQRLQNERPNQALDIGTADRGDGITVSGMRGSKGGRIVLDSGSGENLTPAGGVKRVHFVGRAG